jgi:hypothetical protein
MRLLSARRSRANARTSSRCDTQDRRLNPISNRTVNIAWRIVFVMRGANDHRGQSPTPQRMGSETPTRRHGSVRVSLLGRRVNRERTLVRRNVLQRLVSAYGAAHPDPAQPPAPATPASGPPPHPPPAPAGPPPDPPYPHAALQKLSTHPPWPSSCMSGAIPVG